MRQTIASLLHRLARAVTPKGAASANPIWTAAIGEYGFVDAYRQHRVPSPDDLLDELKNTAWTCASINAAVCAAHPPRLYVRTGPLQSRPRCRTQSLAANHPLALAHKGTALVEEVTEHPLLDLLRQVNPTHNQFDLLELTELYLEIFGAAYWLLERDGFGGIPSRIWILPAQHVRPSRAPGSRSLVDAYEYRQGAMTQHFAPDEIIHFRFPDPRDPYAAGLSPLKACFEQVALASQYSAMKRAIYENTGIPSVVLSAPEALGTDERSRLETEWNQKFRKGGQGRLLIAETSLKLDVISHSMGDLAALAEARATKEDIANAFHVPIPYLTGETNLANMEAAEIFHLRLAIVPRLRRRDEKLNEQLLPLYDPTGRLFFASEDPTPANRQHLLAQQAQDLKLGVRTINEVRAERGLPPVSWGHVPFQVSGNATVRTPTDAGVDAEPVPDDLLPPRED